MTRAPRSPGSDSRVIRPAPESSSSREISRVLSKRILSARRSWEDAGASARQESATRPPSLRRPRPSRRSCGRCRSSARLGRARAAPLSGCRTHRLSRARDDPDLAAVQRRRPTAGRGSYSCETTRSYRPSDQHGRRRSGSQSSNRCEYGGAGGSRRSATRRSCLFRRSRGRDRPTRPPPPRDVRPRDGFGFIGVRSKPSSCCPPTCL